MIHIIYFSSDLHFGHDRSFIYAARGFSSIDEMNIAIIHNFNSVVTCLDDLYLLGDIVMGNSAENIHLFQQLKGKIHLVWGNHDTSNRQRILAQQSNVVEVLGYADILTYEKQNFYLCHFPTSTSNFDEDKPLNRKLLCLAGHTHSTEKFDPCGSYNVAVDAHNCRPVSIETVLDDFKERKKQYAE